MIFPIGDDNITGGAKPIFSYAFIGFNIIMWIVQLMSGPNLLVCEWALVPAEIVRGEDYFSFFTSMFMHGSWMHIIGNMVFLWVFADNIEQTIGNIPFFIFYILGGIFASMLHIFFSMGGPETAQMACCNPCLENCRETARICVGTVPSLGASGALSAVMGAYLVMFPKSRVKILVLYFMRSFYIPAYVALGGWIALQLFSGVSSIGAATGGGTAWWAHIGGFVFGVIGGLLFRFLMGSKVEPNEPKELGNYV